MPNSWKPTRRTYEGKRSKEQVQCQGAAEPSTEDAGRRHRKQSPQMREKEGQRAKFTSVVCVERLCLFSQGTFVRRTFGTGFSLKPVQPGVGGLLYGQPPRGATWTVGSLRSLLSEAARLTNGPSKAFMFEQSVVSG
ncbi:hypothetical protein BSKO_01865 [Bryopsis sp. KO-2023]|nr:hypothetical protein BSKO_01865 [Bryopsis sp. KO-2023]